MIVFIQNAMIGTAVLAGFVCALAFATFMLARFPVFMLLSLAIFVGYVVREIL